MRRTTKTAWLAIGIAWALAGCDEATMELELRSADAGEPEPCDGMAAPSKPFDHPAPYDCAENQDQGYDQGNPFEITVVHMDGEPVEKDTANAFWVMREAAAADGVDIHIVSGFRTMSEQEYFYMCYTCCCCNDCNLAAQPGYSNHQSGHALDLNASAPGVYAWLAAHGGEYGFSETVPSENWHWEWWGGGPGGGICDITVAPGGSVDVASCDTISGWAQDPDAPDEPVEVQVVFDGALGDPGVTVVSVVADQHRDDLCDAIGSCAHAFEVPYPLGLRDGGQHPVHVYAMDLEGEMNAELTVSPPSACAAPPIPEGVRRHVPDPEAFTAWGFSPVWHVAHVDDADLEALDEGVDLGPQPFVVTTAGSTELWLVEHGWRRSIASAEIAAAWGFDAASATELDAAALELIDIGPPVRATPFVVQGSGPEMYLVDDDLEDPRTTDSGADGSDDASDGVDPESDGGSGGEDSGLPGFEDQQSDGGCGCRADRGSSPWFVVILFGAARRRARARARARARSGRPAGAR